MKAITQLQAEHEQIYTACTILEKLADELLNGRLIDTLDAEELVEYFSVYADQCHHSKEEQLLFPLISQHGSASESSRIGVMLYEHTHGREYISSMNKSITMVNTQTQAAQAFTTAAYGCSKLLQNHMMKEEMLVYSAAQQLLSQQQHTELSQQIDQFEVDRLSSAGRLRYQLILERLSVAYL